MRRIAWLALAVVVGCVPRWVERKSPEVTRGRFAPERRDELWTRAKSILETRGYKLSASDRPGLLRTEFNAVAPRPCPSAVQCDVRQSVEIVLLSTGEASVEIHREYYFPPGKGFPSSGWLAPVDARSVQDIEVDQARLLSDVLSAPCVKRADTLLCE
jgi:hypothetical protein